MLDHTRGGIKVVNARVFKTLIDPEINFALSIPCQINSQIGVVSNTVSELIMGGSLLASVFQIKNRWFISKEFDRPLILQRQDLLQILGKSNLRNSEGRANRWHLQSQGKAV